MICTTWQCGRPAIAVLTVRRQCGHPVADGQPVQMQWHCRAHVWARAGGKAPGPSTCPTCGVRQPVTTDPLVHGAPDGVGIGDILLKPKFCGRPLERGESIVYDRSEPVTCPDCLEWMHA